MKGFCSAIKKARPQIQQSPPPVTRGGLCFDKSGCWQWTRQVRASERQSAPERLAQLFVALSFADTGVSQQTRIQASQLMAAGDAALPQHQVGENAQRQGSLGVYSFFFEEQIGTECTFHDDILPLVAGLGSGLTDANDPPPTQDSLDTVHLYCEGPVNCLWRLYCTEMEQLYLSALK